ncbi:hypothetical protein JCM10908_001327 [Rhodotorula pacifica]|uniref:uncharacterized protein n=1 Tax=Rhodotorula pacifica TaxID=1495444 RepID=UPI00317D9ADD
MELAQQHSHMDRLTQTQNSIDDLVRIMYSSLSYLSRKATFKQINPNFPVTQSIPGADSDQVYEENRKELVGDFLRKAKQLEYLISVLPSPPSSASSSSSDAPSGSANGSTGDEEEFARLEEEMQVVNAEYLDALGEAAPEVRTDPEYIFWCVYVRRAERLHDQLKASLQGVLESRAAAAATTAATTTTASTAGAP